MFVVFRNILFLLFVTWQLLNTIVRFELFPSAGTMVVFRFVMSDSIPNEFGGLRHVRVKKWNTFSQIPRHRGKKVKSFTSEHFRVSNLINHVTLCIKVKKKYSEWIWRFEAAKVKKWHTFSQIPRHRGKKLNPLAHTPTAVKMSEINPKYENTRIIHRLLTNQYPGFLYKV